MDETNPEQENLTLVPVDGAEISPNLNIVSALDDRIIDKMKILELIMVLEKRGISKNGKKAELCTRLKEAVAKNVPLVTERTSVEIDNNLVSAFKEVLIGNYWNEMNILLMSQKWK